MIIPQPMTYIIWTSCYKITVFVYLRVEVDSRLFSGIRVQEDTRTEKACLMIIQAVRDQGRISELPGMWSA